MSLILIDTNVFLELLLGRKRAEECERLLDLVSKGEIEAVVTHFSVHALEAILKDSEALIRLLRNIQYSSGLYVYSTDLTEEEAIAIVSQKIGREFDDSLQYYVAKKLGAECIVSFDKHFDGLDIPRAEPNEILDRARKH